MQEADKKIKPSNQSSRLSRTNLRFCLKFWHLFGSFKLNLKISEEKENIKGNEYRSCFKYLEDEK